MLGIPCFPPCEEFFGCQNGHTSKRKIRQVVSKQHSSNIDRRFQKGAVVSIGINNSRHLLWHHFATYLPDKPKQRFCFFMKPARRNGWP